MKKTGKILLITWLSISGVIFVLVVTAVVTAVVLSLKGCSLNYDTAEYENFVIGYSNFDKDCFAGSYTWDGDTENMEVNVPDYYNGYPIKKLGGYFGRGVPTPFYIGLTDDYCNDGIWSISDDELAEYTNNADFSFRDLNFTVNIGKNLSEIQFVCLDYWAFKNEDNTVIFTRTVYYINCSEENETFYSADGLLYYRSNNALVEELYYG